MNITPRHFGLPFHSPLAPSQVLNVASRTAAGPPDIPVSGLAGANLAYSPFNLSAQIAPTPKAIGPSGTFTLAGGLFS